MQGNENFNGQYGDSGQIKQDIQIGVPDTAPPNAPYGMPNQAQPNVQYGVPNQAPPNAPYGTPYNGQQYYTQPLVRDAIPKNNSFMAVTSLTVSIFALIGFWVPVWNLVLGIAGLVCGIICIAKNHTHSGMGVAGLVISIIALVLSIIFYLILILAVV